MICNHKQCLVPGRFTKRNEKLHRKVTYFSYKITFRSISILFDGEDQRSTVKFHCRENLTMVDHDEIAGLSRLESNYYGIK